MSENEIIEKIGRPGILNREQIKKLMDEEKIVNGIPEDIGLSSFDLHLGRTGWKLTAGFKYRKDRTIKEIIEPSSEIVEDQFTLTNNGKILDINSTYLFELRETINFEENDNYWGQGTGKSTIGRLDVLTRLLADEEERYDIVNKDLKNLYVEITPLSFPIILFPGVRIYQLRISLGDFDELQIPKDMFDIYSVALKDRDGNNYLKKDKLTHLRLNLEATDIAGFDTIAFKAKKRVKEPIKLNADKGTYSPEDYWERSSPETKICNKNALIIEKNAFYITRSRERFELSRNIAVYGLAMTEEVGELRIHHAGFVHPFFGKKRRDKKGAPLIFEVRGHDVDMILLDCDLMAELRYYPMSKSAEPDKKEREDDSFSDQELSLPEMFKDWGHED